MYFLGNVVQKFICKGENKHMKITYNGYVLEFSDDGATKFEEVLCSSLEVMAPIYIKQELRENAKKVTAEELRAAIVRGASEEMSMFNLKFQD